MSSYRTSEHVTVTFEIAYNSTELEQCFGGKYMSPSYQTDLSLKKVVSIIYLFLCVCVCGPWGPFSKI